MDYEISLASTGKYIVCRVIGPMTVDIARQFAKDMDQLSRERNIKRFLTDVRNAPNVSDVFQNYTFANKDMADLNLQRDVRAAVLVDPNDKSHDFIETVTQNAGYVVRVFDDENAAILWLDEL